jgi:hypothetical protein
LERQWKTLLWQGDSQALERAIGQAFKGKRRRQQALRKWQNYFAPNAQRLQSQHFQSQGLPCGSGSVESAIRRVISNFSLSPGNLTEIKS